MPAERTPTERTSTERIPAIHVLAQRMPTSHVPIQPTPADIYNFNRRSREAAEQSRARRSRASDTARMGESDNQTSETNRDDQTRGGYLHATRRRQPVLMKHSNRRRNHRRSAADSTVIIMWRDIPAQVNNVTGSSRAQRVLPLRFQKAIDRAATVAGKTEASQYISEWRRVILDHNMCNLLGILSGDVTDLTFPVTENTVAVDTNTAKEDAVEDDTAKKNVAENTVEEIAEKIEQTFPINRLNRFVENAGWDPDNTRSTRSDISTEILK